MPFGITVSNVDWSQSLAGAPKLSQHPMLENSLGVEGLFYSRSVKSWPKQGQPDASNQRLLNIAPSPSVSSLLLGGTTATELSDPSFFNNGFLTSSANGSFLGAESASSFSYTTTSFLHTFWFKAGPLWNSVGGVRMLSSKYGGADAQYALYYNADSGAIEGQWVTSLTENNAIAVSFSPIIGNTYGIAMGWVKTGASTSQRLLFIQGKKVFDAPMSVGSLYNSTARYLVGSSSVGFGCDLIWYQSYFENLDVSGNDPAERVAFEYSRLKNKF